MRIILNDPVNDRVTGRDLPLAAVEGIEQGENGDAEPVLCIIARPHGSGARRLFMTFRERPGFSRSGERDAWVQWIGRFRDIRPASLVGSGTLPEPADVNPPEEINALHRGGIRAEERHDPHPAESIHTVPSFIGIHSGSADPLMERQAGYRADQKKIMDAIVRKTPSPPVKYPSPPATIPVRTADPYANGPSFFCLACGNRVPAGASFCNRCGASLIQPGTEVVRSPWDPPQPGEDPTRLAERWGVPVVPSAGAARQHSSEEDSGTPAPTPPVPGLAVCRVQGGVIPGYGKAGIPTTGFTMKRVAALTVLIVVAGLFIAMMEGAPFAPQTAGVSAMNPMQPGETLRESETGRLSHAGDSTVLTNPRTVPSGTSVASGTSSEAIPSRGTYIRVAGSGTWDGSYGAVPIIWAVRGFGEKVYAVETASNSPVSAIFKTTGTSGHDLTVQIYQDGTIINSGRAGSDGTVTL